MLIRQHTEKIPYLIFSTLIFIFLPFTYYIFDNKIQVLINSVIYIFSILAFAVSFAYSYQEEKFSYLFSLFLSAPFLISCIIFLNSEVIIYILMYIFLSLCGQGSGYSVKQIIKFRQRHQNKK